MAESSAKEGLDELVNKLVGSMQATAATEQAIHKMTQDIIPALTTAVTDVVKNNAFPAEIAQENLKLQKAVIERTIDAINALAPNSNTAQRKS